ncbi:hypothetical protein ACWC4A_52535 [Streptomyces mirabilis]
MNPTHLAVDGYVEAIPAPGTDQGTATFDLILFPSNADDMAPDAPDTVFACSTADPAITDMLLTEVQPGDLVRVRGTADQPEASDAPARLTVYTLEVLPAPPVPLLHDMVLDRYGKYVVVFNADADADADIGADAVPVFTATGEWVGHAASPDAIEVLIDIHERVHGGDA